MVREIKREKINNMQQSEIKIKMRYQKITKVFHVSAEGLYLKHLHLLKELLKLLKEFIRLLKLTKTPNFQFLLNFGIKVETFYSGKVRC